MSVTLLCVKHPRVEWNRGPSITTGIAFEADLNRIALQLNQLNQLNQRPRKVLNFRCPAGVFNQGVALTG